MPRNVEIKASVSSLPRFLKLVEALTDKEKTVLVQKDVFYKCPGGRLKLRSIKTAETLHSELIFYQRPDQSGPKVSEFHTSPVANPDTMEDVLSKSLGRRGVVEKIRYLYMIGQTRVHVDQVKDLGNFMELEVMLDSNQTAEDGALIAKDLMQKLDISADNLINKAYMDLILEKQ